VHDVSRIARQPESADDLDKLHLAVFDLLEIDGKPAPAGCASTFKTIESIFKSGTRIRPVESTRGYSAPQTLVSAGWNGALSCADTSPSIIASPADFLVTMPRTSVTSPGKPSDSRTLNAPT
jgi:hypothetical protein